MNKGMWLMSFLMILGGLGSLICGLVLDEYRKRKEFYKGHTKAKVISLEVQEDPDATQGFRHSYYPVLEYYAEGKLYTQVHDEGSYPSRYKVGDEFFLAYDPEAPEYYMITEISFQRLLPRLLYMLGVLLLVSGTIIFICFAFRT